MVGGPWFSTMAEHKVFAEKPNNGLFPLRKAHISLISTSDTPSGALTPLFADIDMAAKLELAQTAPLLDPAENSFDSTTGMDRSCISPVAGRAAIEPHSAQPNHWTTSHEIHHHSWRFSIRTYSL